MLKVTILENNHKHKLQEYIKLLKIFHKAMNINNIQFLQL